MSSKLYNAMNMYVGVIIPYICFSDLSAVGQLNGKSSIDKLNNISRSDEACIKQISLENLQQGPQKKSFNVGFTTPVISIAKDEVNGDSNDWGSQGIHSGPACT